ncbi:MAG: hypothetical protein GX803_02775 [Lentisphaerae bacterium]|nr:hypothetical protein [Lentisphaerota bacterium]
MKASTFTRFLSRLIRRAAQKIFLIVDNLRIQRSVGERKWVAGRADRIELFYFPPYSPEFNPDENLNPAIKAQLKNRPWGFDRKAMHSAGHAFRMEAAAEPGRTILSPLTMQPDLNDLELDQLEGDSLSNGLIEYCLCR